MVAARRQPQTQVGVLKDEHDRHIVRIDNLNELAFGELSTINCMMQQAGLSWEQDYKAAVVITALKEAFEARLIGPKILEVPTPLSYCKKRLYIGPPCNFVAANRRYFKIINKGKKPRPQGS